MATINIVRLSELGGTTGRRIDAEYYDPRSVKLEHDLQKVLHSSLGKMGVKVDGSAFYPSIAEYYQGSGIPFLRVSDIMGGFIKEEDMIFLPPEVADKFPSIRKGYPRDIIITKGGTVGTVALLPDKFPRYALSRDLILVQTSILPLEQAILIMLFLIGKYGKFQLLRGKSQQVQPHLTLPLIKSLFLPYLEVKDAVKHYIDSTSYFEKSKSLYSQAEILLLEELGLKDFKPKYELSYTANLSKAFGVHRVDAEYFQPAYDEVIRKIIDYSNDYTQLLSYVEGIKPDFDPTKYPDRIFSYVELADIDASIGVIHSAGEIKGEEAPSRARRILRKNDVIVSSVEGSLEKVALVDERNEGFLASTGFFQFRPVKILPEILLVLSKSIVLQAQLKKECAGTILTAVPNESIKRILIPLIPDNIQQKIASLVQQSHEARRKAKELLEEAKRKVEETIESRIKN